MLSLPRRNETYMEAHFKIYHIIPVTRLRSTGTAIQTWRLVKGGTARWHASGRPRTQKQPLGWRKSPPGSNQCDYIYSFAHLLRSPGTVT